MNSMSKPIGPLRSAGGWDRTSDHADGSSSDQTYAEMLAGKVDNSEQEIHAYLRWRTVRTEQIIM